jgi:hypothetical protein
MAAAVVMAAGFAQAQKVQPKKGGDAELTTASSKRAASKSMVFEKAEVLGYLDAQSPMAILDIGEADADPITLNRSFKEALKQNSDKESMERMIR